MQTYCIAFRPQQLETKESDFRQQFVNIYNYKLIDYINC